MKFLYRIARILIYLTPIIIFASLFYLDICPSGVATFTYTFKEDSPVITRLFPENRLSDPIQISKDNYYQQINQEPVYFETRLSQKFDSAMINIEFQNPESSLFQLGLATIGDDDWNYQFMPLDNKSVNDLNWSKIETDNLTLWQRNDKYKTIDSFLKNFTNEEGVAIYNYDVKKEFKISGYQSGDEIRSFDHTIRGYHNFYTYIENEELYFNFKVQDINRKTGPDVLNVNVYDAENNKIYTKRLDDDGYLSNLDPASLPRYVTISLGNLKDGVYRIELDCEDEIFIRQIKTKQKYLTFIERLYLADNPEYSDGFVDMDFSPVSIYSSVSRISLETAHPAGLQEVLIGSSRLSIIETHKKYYFDVNTSPLIITSQKNDLKIYGNGLFAFDKDSYFNPEMFNLKNFQESDNINFLLAGYHEPKSVDGWLVNGQTFDLDKAQINNRKLRWMLSSPEMNDLDGKIRIKSIKITYFKEPMTWEEFWAKSINFIKKFI